MLQSTNKELGFLRWSMAYKREREQTKNYRYSTICYVARMMHYQCHYHLALNLTVLLLFTFHNFVFYVPNRIFVRYSISQRALDGNYTGSRIYWSLCALHWPSRILFIIYFTMCACVHFWHAYSYPLTIPIGSWILAHKCVSLFVINQKLKMELCKFSYEKEYSTSHIYIHTCTLFVVKLFVCMQTWTKHDVTAPCLTNLYRFVSSHVMK